MAPAFPAGVGPGQHPRRACPVHASQPSLPSRQGARSAGSPRDERPSGAVAGAGQYSLTRADDGEHRQSSVKRVRGGGKPDGEVSNHLCDTVQVGDVLTLSLPFGDVVLDDWRPAVFVSAGIGITPMAGMLSHLRHAGSGLPITLLHADSDESSFALRGQVLDDVRALPNATVHVWYESGAAGALPVDGVHAGTMDVGAVDLPDGAACYLCGPLPFMQAVRSALIDRGVASRDIRYEVFGLDLWQADFRTEPAPGTHAYA